MDTIIQDAVKASLEGKTYNELVGALLQSQQAHRDAKDRAAEAWEVVCVIARQVIPGRMDRDQIQNITVILPDGTKKQLLVIPQVSVKTPAENKEALWGWLREHDAEALITETVNSSTLAAFVRAQMKAGDDYPNELCEVSVYDVASLRKA